MSGEQAAKAEAPAEGYTLDSAANAILQSGLLGDDEDNATESPEQEAFAQAPSAGEELEAGPDDLTADDLAEVTDEDNNDEVQDINDEDSPKLFTVKIDGKESQVTKEELINGYQRDADYRKKTQALAEERRFFETQRDHLEQIGQYLDEVIPGLQQKTANEFADIQSWADVQRLSAEDPARYIRFDAHIKGLQQAERAKETIKAQQEEIENQEFSSWIKEEHKKLLSLVPDYADPVKGKRLAEQVKQYAVDNEYGDDLLRKASARDFVILQKAMLYDRAMSNKNAAKKQPTPLTKSLKPGTGVRAGNNQNRDTAMKRLKSTGRVEDAAVLLKDFV